MWHCGSVGYLFGDENNHPTVFERLKVGVHWGCGILTQMSCFRGFPSRHEPDTLLQRERTTEVHEDYARADGILPGFSCALRRLTLFVSKGFPTKPKGKPLAGDLQPAKVYMWNVLLGKDFGTCWYFCYNYYLLILLLLLLLFLFSFLLLLLLETSYEWDQQKLFCAKRTEWPG